MTWLRQHYDAKRISPYPAWYAMQRAMQPVLVSAELWGRNLYEGEHLKTRIYVVNDSDNGKDLPASQLTWSIVSGLTECTDAEAALLRAYQAAGGRLVFLNSKEVAKKVFPEYIEGWIIPTEGDIVVMERDNAPVFDGIDVLDLRYFNNNRREIPLACTATLKTPRCEAITELASQMKIHAYIDGGKAEDRIGRIESMRGLTLLQIAEGKGKAMVSTMCTGKALTDPIAGHLLVNIINEAAK